MDWKLKLYNRKRQFSYIEIIISITAFIIIMTFILKANAFLHNMEAKSNIKEKELYVAQSILEVYKNQGKQEAEKYKNDYNVVIKEIDESPNLRKVVITVKRGTDEKNKIELCDYVFSNKDFLKDSD